MIKLIRLIIFLTHCPGSPCRVLLSNPSKNQWAAGQVWAFQDQGSGRKSHPTAQMASNPFRDKDTGLGGCKAQGNIDPGFECWWDVSWEISMPWINLGWSC
jgi:hypothetical protein